jgi:perosamine synthetase
VIPLFKPSCSNEEIEAVTRVMKSGWWGMGPEVEAFESEFGNYVGARYAIAVSSGTAALEIAARATGQVNGSVIVPALTFVSTAQAMAHAGNEVIFADIDPLTLCLDWDSVRHWLPSCESGTRAVVPVWYGGHVSGVPSDILDDVAVIEDCAHAVGSLMAGKYGLASAWSFHAVKNLATGDGGMITTDSIMVARKARQLRWCGIDRSTYERDTVKGYGWDYNIPGDGHKAHMNDITAAIGRVQLRRLDDMNSERRRIACHYHEEFRNDPWLTRPAVEWESSMHLYVVRVADRDRFVDHMIGQGVSAGVHYKPLTHYDSVRGKQTRHSLPVTERVWKTLVTLPLYPDMTDGEVEQVINAVRSFKP